MRIAKPAVNIPSDPLYFRNVSGGVSTIDKLLASATMSARVLSGSISTATLLHFDIST